MLPTTAPDPRVARVNFLQNGGVSNYNGISSLIQENTWHGLSGRLNYTYSHALDDISNGGVLPFSVITSLPTQINPYNLNSNYASSDYDARHELTASYVYQLPFKSEHRLVQRGDRRMAAFRHLFLSDRLSLQHDRWRASGALAGNNLWPVRPSSCNRPRLSRAETFANVAALRYRSLL